MPQLHQPRVLACLSWWETHPEKTWVCCGKHLDTCKSVPGVGCCTWLQARLAWLSWGGAPGLCQWSRQAAPSGGPVGGVSLRGVPSGGVPSDNPVSGGSYWGGSRQGACQGVLSGGVVSGGPDRGPYQGSCQGAPSGCPLRRWPSCLQPCCQSLDSVQGLTKAKTAVLTPSCSLLLMSAPAVLWRLQMGKGWAKHSRAEAPSEDSRGPSW